MLNYQFEQGDKKKIEGPEESGDEERKADHENREVDGLRPRRPIHLFKFDSRLFKITRQIHL